MIRQAHTVRTRIAPSPTGENLHIGNVYTALINYAWAKKHKGSFILRIEDTDQKRKVEGAEQRILNSLYWFGLIPDESVKVGGPFAPYRQSERLSLYKKYAEQLVHKGHAYYCDCSPERLSNVRKAMQKKGLPPKYDRHCFFRQDEINKKHAVIRMKVPDSGTTTFHDMIRGDINIENSILDDQVLLKSDGYPTYHLAVVVDDHLMGITHIIRAEEWISSTPKHVLLYSFFRWNLPKIAHLPILRNPDHSKLSKRRNPVWVSWYRKKGYLPDAIINYLATLGWSHPEGKDIFSLNEFVKKFDIKDVQKGAPIFDIVKLSWMNGEYIRNLSTEELTTRIENYLKIYKPPYYSLIQKDKKIFIKSIPLIQTRIKTLSEYWSMCEFLYQSPTSYEKNVNNTLIKEVLQVAISLTRWDHKSLYNTFSKKASSLHLSKSKFFMDIRIAITGKKIGPPLFESMTLLGKRECVKRLQRILK